MRTWFSAAVVSILTAIFLSLLAQGHANVQDDRAQDNQPARKSLVVPKGTSVVLRLAGTTRYGGNRRYLRVAPRVNHVHEGAK